MVYNAELGVKVAISSRLGTKCALRPTRLIVESCERTLSSVAKGNPSGRQLLILNFKKLDAVEFPVSALIFFEIVYKVLRIWLPTGVGKVMRLL